MANNFTGLQSGLSTGILSDQLPLQPIYTYIVTPAAGGEVIVDQQATFQAMRPVWISSNNNTTWVQSNQNVWTTNITTNIQFQNSPVAVFDCMRSVIINFINATENAVIATVNGFDDNGVAVTWTSAEIPIGTLNVQSTKCFRVINSFYFSACPWTDPTAANNLLQIESGLNIGLPYLLSKTNYLLSSSWANENALPYTNLGIVWRQTVNPPGLTSIPSPTSTDARGYVNLNDQIAPDGSNMLIVRYYVYGFDETVNTQLSVLGQSQLLNKTNIFNIIDTAASSANIVQIQNNSSGNPTLATLVSQDRFGAQFPGDLAFMNYYNKLLQQ